MTRTYRVNITRTDRDSLPSGAVIGFGYLLQAATLEDAERHAAERMARAHNAEMLYLESVLDVTP